MEKYLALKASAGSGKTFALTVRYVSLLFLEVPPKEILTLTFTKKAVAQMEQRIFDTFFTLGEDKAILDAISLTTNLTPQQILSKKETIKKQFLSSSLSIFTIDKFINKILREFSGYAKLSDDFSIGDDDEELLLYKFLISLDKVKFDSLVRFSHIQEKKLNSLLSLFKTLDEKNEDFAKLIKPIKYNDNLENNLMTLANKIKAFVLKQSLSSRAKNSVDFTNIKELLVKGTTWLEKDYLKEYSYFKKADIPNSMEDIFQDLKNNIILYFRQKENITLKHLIEIFDDFKTFRNNFNKNKNTLEFRDITNIVYKLLQTHIQKDFLYFRLDSYYSSILIDEFQDTSTLQFKILQPLIQEILSGNDEKFKTFFYVGDTKQSIYRFRGGAKELFDYVANQFGQIKVQILDTNYRSSKNIVEFVNQNFIDIPNYEYHLQQVISKIDGYVQVRKLDTNSPYNQISTKLNELLEDGVSPNNIAILTYTNEDVLNLYLHLKQKFPTLHIITEMTSKLISEQNIQALINAIKYLYFKEDLYLSNFNALVGKKYKSLSPFSQYNNFKHTNIIQLIRNISQEFNLIDQNMLKFIELVDKFDNIIDFIYEIDKLEANQINKDSFGIQILTVFKSKGLEFDTVLVVDRIKQKNSDKSPLLFEYQDISLTNIYHKQKDREKIDILYNDALLKEKKLSMDDELNILYVALTRAKNNLIVFKKDKLSVFDLINCCDIKTIGKLYIPQNNKTQKKQAKQLEYSPLDLGLQEKQVETNTQDDINIKAKYFGIATHYCLEMMGEFTKKSLSLAIGMAKNRYSDILNDDDFKDIFSRILKLLDNKTFKDIISNGKIMKEQALIFNEQIKIIDLLIKKDNQYIICDYKTTTALRDEHISQVTHYKKAVSNITKTPTTAYLVYLQKEKTEIVLCA